MRQRHRRLSARTHAQAGRQLDGQLTVKMQPEGDFRTTIECVDQHGLVLSTLPGPMASNRLTDQEGYHRSHATDSAVRWSGSSPSG
ncbi:MAG: hypothetical protein MUE68_01220 [Bacteroidetes bacterium]|nr:hypothetical protein [Bacteroidota bacterium]